MKKLICLLAITMAFSVEQASAQPDAGPQKQKMKALSLMAGTWTGTGRMQRGPGEPLTSTAVEEIAYRLDSTVLFVQGIGKHKDPASNKEVIVHEALGIISYDAPSSTYRFQSYIRTGQSTNSELVVLSDNKYQWGFEVPQGKISYTITLDPVKGTWTEVGQFIPPGGNASDFFHMDLQRKL